MTPQTLETLVAENQRLRESQNETWNIVVGFEDVSDRLSYHLANYATSTPEMRQVLFSRISILKSRMRDISTKLLSPSPAPQPDTQEKCGLTHDFGNLSEPCKRCGISWEQYRQQGMQNVYKPSPSESSASSQVCPHGSLKRSCEICEAQALVQSTLEECQKEVEALTAERDALFRRANVTKEELEWLLKVSILRTRVINDDRKMFETIRAKNPTQYEKSKSI